MKPGLRRAALVCAALGCVTPTPMAPYALADEGARTEAQDSCAGRGYSGGLLASCIDSAHRRIAAKNRLDLLVKAHTGVALKIVERCVVAARDSEGTLEGAVTCAETGIAALPPDERAPAIRREAGASVTPAELPSLTAISLRYCEAEWPSDFAMRRYCVERQNKAGLELAQLSATLTAPNPRRAILDRCLLEWKKGEDLFDFAMAQFCYGRQVEAMEALEKMEPR